MKDVSPEECLSISTGDNWINKHLANTNVLWKPVSLTYVLYPEGDIVGKLLACSSLIPMFILSSFVTLIFFRRELHTMAFFGGILLNELLNIVLKHSIQSPRPCRPMQDTQHLLSKHGMPSNHAQFMGFFGVYLILFAYIRMRLHTCEKFTDNLRRHGTVLASLCSVVMVCYSRVYLRYHTVEQVMVGLIVGVLAGASWFYVVESFSYPLFQEIVNSRLAEYFLVRDSSSIPDILWFEYTASRTEARQRLKRVEKKFQ